MCVTWTQRVCLPQTQSLISVMKYLVKEMHGSKTLRFWWHSSTNNLRIIEHAVRQTTFVLNSMRTNAFDTWLSRVHTSEGRFTSWRIPWYTWYNIYVYIYIYCIRFVVIYLIRRMNLMLFFFASFLLSTFGYGIPSSICICISWWWSYKMIIGR